MSRGDPSHYGYLDRERGCRSKYLYKFGEMYWVAITTIDYRRYRSVMEYEWCEAKRLTNLRKYGIAFAHNHNASMLTILLSILSTCNRYP